MAKLVLTCLLLVAAASCIKGAGSRRGSVSEGSKQRVESLTKLCADEVARQLVPEFAGEYQAAVKGILYPHKVPQALDKVDAEVTKILEERYGIGGGALTELVKSIRQQAEQQPNPKKRKHQEEPLDWKVLGMVPRCVKKPKA